MKGLSPNYSYTVTATKEGYSVDKTYVSGLPKDKTFILESQLRITKVPQDFGVFIFSDGKLTKIEQNQLMRDKFADDGYHSGYGRTDFFYYLEQKDMKYFLKGIALLVNLPEKPYGYYIRDLSFFSELEAYVQDQSPGYNPWIWKTKKQQNIFIEGVMKSRENDKRVAFYKNWHTGNEYKNPTGWTGIGTTTLEGEVPCVESLLPSGKIYVIQISYLPKGTFTLSTNSSPNSYNSDDKGIRWVFTVQ